jgi:hypothetical protein
MVDIGMYKLINVNVQMAQFGMAHTAHNALVEEFLTPIQTLAIVKVDLGTEHIVQYHAHMG